MTRARLTGSNSILLSYDDGHGHTAIVSIGRGAAVIDGIVFPAHMLEGLASMAARDAHLMGECVWVDCPEHACPYDHSHTQRFCGRPTCRVS